MDDRSRKPRRNGASAATGAGKGPVEKRKGSKFNVSRGQLLWMESPIPCIFARINLGLPQDLFIGEHRGFHLEQQPRRSAHWISFDPSTINTRFHWSLQDDAKEKRIWPAVITFACRRTKQRYFFASFGKSFAQANNFFEVTCGFKTRFLDPDTDGSVALVVRFVGASGDRR